jgi:hypothetical protein
MQGLVVKGGHGATAANRRLNITVTIGALTDDGGANLRGIAQNEHCSQHENRCGRQVPLSRLHFSPKRG